MKLISVVIVASCIALTLGDHGKHGLPEFKFMAECMKEENIEFKKGQPLNKDDPKLGCVAACVMEKTGKINENGEVDLEKFPNHMQDLVKKCSESSSGDRCGKAGALSKCIWEDMIGKAKTVADECAKETQTDVDLSDFKNLIKVWKDEKKACFNRCLLIKGNKMDENNNFIVPEEWKEKGAELRQKCIDENQQSDQCIQAVARENCIVKAVFARHGKKGHGKYHKDNE